MKRSELSGVFVRSKAARHEGLGWWQLAVRLCQQILLLLVPWRAAGLARVDLEPREPPATAAASDRPQGGRGGRLRLQRRQRCPRRGSQESRVALGSPGCRQPCQRRSRTAEPVTWPGFAPTPAAGSRACADGDHRAGSGRQLAK